MKKQSECPGRSCVHPWLPILLLLTLCGLHASPAWGQLTSGSLTGILTDPFAAVIPGAKIISSDTEQAYDCAGATDRAGRYLITNLPPSTYQIRVAAAGFRTFTQPGIILNAGTRLSVDVDAAIQDIMDLLAAA